MPQEASRLVQQTARSILRFLREHHEGANKTELATQHGVSPVSIQRALTWLRDVCDAPVEFDRSRSHWQLLDQDFSLPMSDPESEDLAAILFAQALLEPIADDNTIHRVQRLAEQMDAELRGSSLAHARTQAHSLMASVSSTSAHDPKVLATLLLAAGKSVVSIHYQSPWSQDAATRIYDLEPWQLRIHDGIYYLRAWSRRHQKPRTFRISNIHQAHVQKELKVSTALPPLDKIWGHDDPSTGIDHDRPDHGVIQVRGGTARWLHQLIWHPKQEDRWLEKGELLERTFPYASCREAARRILGLGDAIQHIEPKELRQEVLHHSEALRNNLREHASAEADAEV